MNGFCHKIKFSIKNNCFENLLVNLLCLNYYYNFGFVEKPKEFLILQKIYIFFLLLRQHLDFGYYQCEITRFKNE